MQLSDDIFPSCFYDGQKTLKDLFIRYTIYVHRSVAALIWLLLSPSSKL